MKKLKLKVLTAESVEEIQDDLNIVKKYIGVVRSYFEFTKSSIFVNTYDFIYKSDKFLKSQNVADGDKEAILSLVLYLLTNQYDEAVLSDIKDNIDKTQLKTLNEILKWADDFSEEKEKIETREAYLETGNWLLSNVSYSMHLTLALKKANEDVVFSGVSPLEENLDLQIPTAKVALTLTQNDRTKNFEFLVTKSQLDNMIEVLKGVSKYLGEMEQKYVVKDEK